MQRIKRGIATFAEKLLDIFLYSLYNDLVKDTLFACEVRYENERKGNASPRC